MRWLLGPMKINRVVAAAGHEEFRIKRKKELIIREQKGGIEELKDNI